MSEIQDEAYSEACEEIERLKALCARAADMLEETTVAGITSHQNLINQLREAAK